MESAAWVVALGISAGYLINQKVQTKSLLNESVAAFQKRQEPSTSGVTTAEVRKVNAESTAKGVQSGAGPWGDAFNPDLPKKERVDVERGMQAHAEQVQAFDEKSGAQKLPDVPRIQGVWMDSAVGGY